MSNKSQLQANNTQLASLIQTLQGKAAGGGETVYVAKETINREYLPINTLGDFEITNLTPSNCEIYVSYALQDDSGIICVGNIFDALEECKGEGVVVNRENYVIIDEEGMLQLGVEYGDEVMPLLTYVPEDMNGISKGTYGFPLQWMSSMEIFTLNAVVLTA